jgi:hypothetical protein
VASTLGFDKLSRKPLEQFHRKLDEAVTAPYGWTAGLAGKGILSRLLALNLERAAMGGAAAFAHQQDEE